jgi:diguanylate cyclase (GGDEF)-like protein
MHRHVAPAFRRLISSHHFAISIAASVFLLSIILGELFVSIERRETEARHNTETLSYAMSIRSRVERELNALLYLNSGLGSYLVVRHKDIQPSEINDILAVLHRSSQHVRNFGVAVGSRLSYVYPLAGNEKAIGIDYRDLPTQWPAIEQVISSGKPALAGPIELIQGGRGLIYRAPLFIDGKYWGMLSTVIDADTLFTSIFQQISDNSFTFALFSQNTLGVNNKPIIGDQSVFKRDNVVIQNIEIPGGQWVIGVQKKPEHYLMNMASALRLASYLLGGLIAWLLYVLMRNRSKLEHLVMFDSLTGLPNRLLLHDRHHRLLARLQRNPQQMCALLFLDLNGFKQINDQFGHKAGDSVLIQAAAQLRKVVRSNDTVARWGGDEFVILLENVTPSIIENLEERLREAIEEPVEVAGNLLTVSTSLGKAIYPATGVELEDLLKTADHLMYQDKTSRKNEQY